MTDDGFQVRCGEPTCGYGLAQVMGAHFLVLELGLVERLDDAGKSYQPPIYALARSIRKRAAAAVTTGRPISPLRSRVRATGPDGSPGVGRERMIDLSHHELVWVRCPRGCRSVTIIQAAEILRHGAAV